MSTNLNWLLHPAKNLDEAARNAALARQQQLTKPPGALGQLETLAIQLAALQGREKPQVDKVFISVFAGDHGIAEESVSAFPQLVTAEMVKNFARGGAAICVLARQLDAKPPSTPATCPACCNATSAKAPPTSPSCPP
jgi:nicotinate-nucleotide--dimethylbenzimidazole phosphoribosyltransferase